MTSAPTPLSICTFNVNSLREVCDRNGFSAGAGEHRVAKLLQELGCDIVCFQECKLSKASLQIFQSLSQAAGWDSYFSFARNPPLANFAGVATFCNTKVTIPRAAEEGLCRVLPAQNPAAAVQELAAAEIKSMAAAAAAGVKPAAVAAAAAAGLQPWPSDLPFPQEQLQGMFTAADAAAVDLDGRCVITDHGLFILINVYLPAATGGDKTAHGRDKVKMDMIRALDARLRCFLAAGRNVLAVGDFNIAALPEDLMATPHPYHDFSDLHLQSRFYRGSIPRVWLRSFIAHNTHTPTAVAAAAAGSSSNTSAAKGDQQQQQQQGMFNSCFNASQHLSVKHPAPAAADRTRVSAADSSKQQQQQQQRSTEPLRCFFMIDSLRRLIPEGFAVYPDVKKGGTKIRPLFTAWDITRNIRNDQHGGRVDYLLVGDAVAYACEQIQQQQQQQDVLEVIMPAVVAAAAAGAPQRQQQQQHGYLSHLNMSMPISQYLSAAYIDRERRWSDHAAVVLKLLLPPAAAALLLPPHGSTAADSSSNNVARSAADEAYMHAPTISSRYLCDKLAAAAAAACIAAAATAGSSSSSSTDMQNINSSSQILGCNIVDTLLKHKGVETEEARVLDRAQALYPASAAAAAASMAAFCDLYAGPATPAAAAAADDNSSTSMSDSLAAAPAAAAGLLPGEVRILPSSNAPTVAFEPFVQRALHNEQIRQLGNAGVIGNHNKSNVTEGLAGLVKQHRRELDEYRDLQQQQRQQQRQVSLEQRQLKRRLVLRTVPAAVAAAAQDLAAAAAGASSSGARGFEVNQDQSKVGVLIPPPSTNLDLTAAAVKLDPDQSNVAGIVKLEQQCVVKADHQLDPDLRFPAASAPSTPITMPAAAAAAAAEACRIQGVYFEGLQMACTSSEEDD